MNRSFLDQLTEVDQYARLRLVQESLPELQAKLIERLVQVAGTLASQGDSKTAFEIAEVAALCAVALDDHMNLARVSVMQAKMLFAKADNQAAIHLSLQALNCLRREFDSLTEFREFFLTHDFEFGVALVDEKIALGPEPARDIDRLSRVERIYQQVGYQLGLGYVFYYLAVCYKWMDSLEAALSYYLKSYKILSDHQMCVTELLLDLCYVYVELNQLEEAQFYLSEAERIFDKEGNGLGLASVYFNKASLLRGKRENRNVVRLYRRAYELYQSHGGIEDAAFVQMNVATTLMSAYHGHQNQSMQLLESAKTTLSEAGNQRQLARATGYLATLLHSMGEYGQARELLLSIVDGAFGDVPTHTKWQAFYVLGDLEFKGGNLIQAYKYYQRAVEIIESIRSRLRTEELIIDFLDLKPDFYGPLVSLASDLGKHIEALSWAEHAKSRAFLNILGNAAQAIRTDVDVTMVGELADIDSQIVHLQRAIDSRGAVESQEILNKWKMRLDELTVNRGSLDRLRRIRNAEVESMIEVKPMDWREIVACLSA